MIRRWSRGQWLLRVIAVAGILVALLATGLVGVWPAAWLVVLVGALAVGYAVVPEAAVGTVAMGFVLAWWGLAFRDGLHPQALVAAAGLLIAHVAGVLAAYGPGRMPVDRATVWLWVRRGLLVLTVAPALWMVAELIRDQPEPDGLWVAGLATALALVVAMAVAFAPGRDAE